MQGSELSERKRCSTPAAKHETYSFGMRFHLGPISVMSMVAAVLELPLAAALIAVAYDTTLGSSPATSISASKLIAPGGHAKHRSQD